MKKILLMLFLFTGLANAQVSDTYAGLVSLFHCDESTGAILSTAVSGSTSTLTLTGTSVNLTGKFGKAVQNTLNTDRIKHEGLIGYGLNGVSSFTVCFWMNIQTNQDVTYFLDDYRTAAPANRTMYSQFNMAVGNKFVNFNVGGIALTHTDPNLETTLTVGDWHHVAFTFKASDYIRLYIDGIHKSSNTTSGNVGTGGTYGQLFAGYFGNDGKAILGLFDDVAIFNRDLSEAEINEIMETQAVVASPARRRMTKVFIQ